MASQRDSNAKRKVSKVSWPKTRVTANQLGVRVETLVLYKNNPYHVVTVDYTGQFLTIKKAANAFIIRDNIPLMEVRLIEKRDPLFNRWALTPSLADFGRTREDELFIIKAMVDATLVGGSGTRREVLTEMLKRNMWMGVWLRACYSEDRDYKFLPKHLNKVINKPRIEYPSGIFVILTYLQSGTKKASYLAREWLSMLETMHEDVRDIANMVLLHKFGNVTYSDALHAMKEAGCVPWLPEKKRKGFSDV